MQAGTAERSVSPQPQRVQLSTSLAASAMGSTSSTVAFGAFVFEPRSVSGADGTYVAFAAVKNNLFVKGGKTVYSLRSSDVCENVKSYAEEYFDINGIKPSVERQRLNIDVRPENFRGHRFYIDSAIDYLLVCVGNINAGIGYAVSVLATVIYPVNVYANTFAQIPSCAGGIFFSHKFNLQKFV